MIKNSGQNSFDRILLTGCSSAGKSTLIAALAANGNKTVTEPGRRIVEQERLGNGSSLPWKDPIAVAKTALAMSLSDLQSLEMISEPVYFDRGILDAAVALKHGLGTSIEECFQDGFPYTKVYLAPPWPEIYVTEPDRRHGLDEAIAEYSRIENALTRLDVVAQVLPKVSIKDRLEFILGK